jgi:hypothetical protein
VVVAVVPASIVCLLLLSRHSDGFPLGGCVALGLKPIPAKVEGATTVLASPSIWIDGA